MADREKIIKAIETHLSTDISVGCDDCTYENDGWCTTRLLADILALLKEQKAVEPKTGYWIYLQYCANEGVYCSECHTKMFDRYPMKKKLSRFCGHCGTRMEGQEVK